MGAVYMQLTTKANDLVIKLVLTDLVEERSVPAVVCFLSLALLLQDSLFSPMSVSRDSSSPLLSSLLDSKPDYKVSLP